MQYRMLGPVEVRRDGEVVELGGRPRALMALLLIHANQVVSTDRIIDELWGSDSGTDRKRALWVVISRLRSALEPDRDKRSDGSILITQLPGYRIAVDPSDIDSHRFEALVGDGRRLLDDDPETAADVLREALALWRGNALEEFTYEPFAIAEIARLSELRMSAVEDRIEADLRIGRWQDLTSELEGLVHQHPLRQRLVAHQMQALYFSGRQGEALRAFDQLRTRLLEELGLDPSSELVTLEARILTDDPTLRPEQSAETTASSGTGLSVRGYELRDQIGSGAMGNVYRAFQPAVGREVAIKVIRPELVNEPDFVRRFEAEAQMIAQLEHPQIVPIFDFWREPDTAFLVMRHFEHGTLSAAIEQGALSIDAAVTIIRQIGSALIAAHRRSMTHGDLKPENVMLDGEANAYLADFGLSSTESRPADEGASHEPPSVQSDTRQFAELTGFVLRNTVADNSDEWPVVDDAVAEILDRASGDSNEDRFPDIQSFLDALTVALANRPKLVLAGPEDVSNPYQGLRAFGEEDAGRFFGRERLVDRLLTRLGHPGPQGRFVAVVGPSGSGKSSVIRAGVVPALRQGAVVDSERWFIATMTPGRHPFVSLANALRRIAVRPTPDLAERLEADGFSLTVERISPDPSAQVVLVVDQFEELFTQASAEDAEAFIDAMVRAVEDRHSGIRVIATLRADFYDRPLQHGKLGELLRLGTEVITPMTPEEIERAITEPAREVGVNYEPGAVARITSDMTGQPAALPLLQHALTEMFDNRVSGTIATSSYIELGGVSGAVARRADALHDELDAARQQVTRELFLRLASVHEGTANTRRRAPITEVTAAAGHGARSVLDAFGRHRLLSFDQDPQTREPTVEIAHEALLTSWGRLRDWLDESRSAVLAQRRLAEAAAEWSAQSEDPQLALSGPRLRNYEGWLDNPPVRLTEREHAFLAASHDTSMAELESERRRVRRLRRLVGVAGVAFLIATVAAGVAIWQQNRAADATDKAEAQAEIAEAQTIAATQSAELADLERMRAQAAATVELNTPLAALLAVESYNIDPSPPSADALNKVLVGAGGRRASMSGRYANSALGADGTFVAMGENAVDVWDLETRTLRHSLPLDNGLGFALSPNGQLVAVTGAAATRIFSTESGNVLAQLPGTHGGMQFLPAGGVQFSPTGTELAALTNDFDPTTANTLEFWDVTDPARPVLVEERVQSENVDSFDWSPAGETYLTTSGTGAAFWDRETGELLWSFTPELAGDSQARSRTRLFRTDGSAVVVAFVLQDLSGSQLFTLDTRDGTLLHPPTEGGSIRAMTWWDEDAEQVVGTFQPAGTGAFDLAEGRELTPSPIVAPNAAQLHIDRSRDRVVASGFLGVEIRGLNGLSALERRVPLTPEQRAGQDVFQGGVFGSISADGTKLLVSIFDASGTIPVMQHDLTNAAAPPVERFPAGFTIGTGDYTLFFPLDNQSVRVLDGNFEPYGETAPLGLERGPAIFWQLSGDGSRHVAHRVNGRIEVYDTFTGDLITEIDAAVVASTDFFQMSISHDGRQVMAASELGWGVFDTTSGELVHSGQGDDRLMPWLAGNTLYSQGLGNEFERLDPVTLEPIGPPLVGHTLVLNDLRDDPDASIIFTQATNGAVRAWDRETGVQVGGEIAIGRDSAGNRDRHGSGRERTDRPSRP